MTDQADRPNILLICVDQWRPIVWATPATRRWKPPIWTGWPRTASTSLRPTPPRRPLHPGPSRPFTGLTPRHHGFVASGYNDRVDWHYDVTMPACWPKPATTPNAWARCTPIPPAT